jgi:hypothetical protein
MSSAPGGTFVAAQKPPLDRRVINIKCASNRPDTEFEIQLG